ncbi:MAG: DMT family transporter [Pelagibacteraceae bacterium]|nr:DMT family transporter [Pelagibacteraceae bacterium]
MSKNFLAILLILISIFAGSTMGVLIKFAQNDVSIYTAAFFRFLIGFIFIFPYILKTKFKVYKTSNILIHIIRSALNFPAMLLTFSALMLVPYEKISALNFLVPFFVTILAVLFLKEKIRIYRISALFIGFIGMMIILRPGIINISLGIQMVLVASFFWSVIIILTKQLTNKDSSITILVYMYTFMTLLTLTTAIIFWEIPTINSLIYLSLAALVGTISHISINHAFKLVEVSMTQPFSFIGLIVASLYGYFLFDESPDIYTWLGAIIIFIGITIITIREMQLNKELVRANVNISQ